MTLSDRAIGAGVLGSPPAVFVINLDRATRRLASVTAEVSAFGWTPERIVGLDARDLDPAALRAVAPEPWSSYQARSLTPGEIGCLVGHRRAWQRLIESEAPWALVLEDDARLGPTTPEALRMFAGQSVFDVAKLEGIATEPRKNKGALVVEGPPSLFLMQTVSAGAAAYCLTLQGAAKLLRITQPMNREADFFIRCYGRTNLVVGEFRPFPAFQDRSESFIGTAREVKGARTFRMRLARTFVRLRESVMRRWRFRRLRAGRPVVPVSMDGSSAQAVGKEV